MVSVGCTNFTETTMLTTTHPLRHPAIAPYGGHLLRPVLLARLLVRIWTVARRHAERSQRHVPYY